MLERLVDRQGPPRVRSGLVSDDELAVSVRRVGELSRAEAEARFDPIELASVHGGVAQRAAAWASGQDVVAALMDLDPRQVRLRINPSGPPAVRCAGELAPPLLSISHHGDWAVAVAWRGEDLPSSASASELIARLPLSVEGGRR